MQTRWHPPLLPVGVIFFLAAGGIVALTKGAHAGTQVLFVGLLLTGTPVLWETVRRAGHGRFAVDLVATFAIVGALILGQPVAGLVIVLMQSGGAALERFAEGKASDAVRALEHAAPRTAHRVSGERVDDVPVADIVAGDVLVIRPGDLVPCDGVIVEGRSDLDAATLTGEPLPIDGRPGVSVMSGTRNGAGLLRMRATAAARASQYERIVELVRTAQASKAPVQRMADRYAVWFTPATLGVCAIAFLISHDWIRVLAVLVVATPCPLILAAPIGIIGGINRAARRGIILRNGGALERLARVDTAVFDKTGTITVGEPRVQAVVTLPPYNRVSLLGYAGAIEQASGHLLARVTVAAAHAERIALVVPTGSREDPGRGVGGTVNGRVVHVGGRAFVLAHCAADADALARLEQGPVVLRAYVAIDGQLAGAIEYADEIRPDLSATLARLRALGIERMLLLSGDHDPTVQAVARSAGFTEARGDLLPTDKAAVVARLRHARRLVMMVGDGTNDAPALTEADVGVALSAHGGGVMAESADVIILLDAFDRVADAVTIARRSIRITRQSIGVGLGLSACAMVFAAAGLIPPVAGAVLQEGIDVAVILNALRSSKASADA
jgi:heavy metal translocating P-type ATPase